MRGPESEGEDEDEEEEDAEGSDAAARTSPAQRLARSTVRDLSALRNRIAMARDVLPLAWSLLRRTETPVAPVHEEPPTLRDTFPEPIDRMMRQLSWRIRKTLHVGNPQQQLLLPSPTLGLVDYLDDYLAAYVCTVQMLEASYRGRRLPLRTQGTVTMSAPCPARPQRKLRSPMCRESDPSNGEVAAGQTTDHLFCEDLGRPQLLLVKALSEGTLGHVVQVGRDHPAQLERTAHVFLAKVRS